MTMIFEQVLTPGVAQLSYLVGDDSSGTVAVIDPQPQVDLYIQLARQYNVAITHLFETHIHADFLSGARTLAHRLGAAQHLVSGMGGARYDFDVTLVEDGDYFEFGSVRLTIRHTPGHTPEHIALELAEVDQPQRPWGVFTGDSLFVGSAGRPDLLGEEQTQTLIGQLYRTLRDYYGQLDAGVLIYPCHGAGSACGASIGDRPVSTIGYERQHNPYLQFQTLEAFRTFVEQEAPPEPHHYRHLKKGNAAGPLVLEQPPVIAGLPPQAFHDAFQTGQYQLVDTRQMLAFGGGHIPGAINIGPRPEMAVWAGQMLSYEQPLLLVVEAETQLDWFLWQFALTGFLQFAGYLVGGMKAWENAGLPLQRLPQMPVQELNEKLHEVQLLDVRSPGEWANGHIPGARHQYVADMRDGQVDLSKLGFDPEQPTVTYCDSGYRANLAASLLQRQGFNAVRNVPGSWQAWNNAGFAVEQ